jgi:cyclase
MSFQKRVMPVLLLKGNNLIKTIKFKDEKYIGNPINAIKIYNEIGVDELIIIDIYSSQNGSKINFELIKNITGECFMPLSYGGGVNTLEDFEKLFSLGVEKVVINQLLLTNPKLVSQAVDIFGAQAIVASVDFKKNLLRQTTAYSYLGIKINYTLIEYLKYCELLGCGEVFLNNIDKDGTWEGYDLKTIDMLSQSINVPLIDCGGAGSLDDIKNVLEKTDASAAGIGSIAVFQKKYMGVLICFPIKNKI